VTTITGTYSSSGDAMPAAVTVTVDDAPARPTPAYASSFTSGVDSWVAFGTGAAVTNDTAPTPDALRLTGPADTSASVHAARTVSGLTIGASYRLSAYVRGQRGQVRLAVRGASEGTEFATTPSGYAQTRRLVTLDFVAQADNVIEVFGMLPGLWNPDGVSVYVDTVTVNPTGSWMGTTIYRSDVNGDDVPVRNPNRLDVPAGFDFLTLWDFEHALTGVVTYRVVDGLGGEATVALDMDELAAGDPPALTIPATALLTSNDDPPEFAPLTAVLNYDEISESQGTVHTVLGRSDRLSNPGTLLTRAGALELFATSYDRAAAVRDVLRTGAVAMIRQDEYAGLDVYFIARSVRISPAEISSRRWLVSVAYDEVPRP
jgi:hypothetical protein